MTRRSLLELAVCVAATPAGIVFFASWTQGAQEHTHSSGAEAPSDPDTFLTYKPQFFSADDFEALQSFTEILIPTDETPGAREAHCAHYMDFLLHAMGDYAPETQAQWRKAMVALKTAGFHSADAKGRESLVEAMSQPERDRNAHHPAYFAFRLIKHENVFAFYTARAGMIGALDYKGNSYNVAFPACAHPEHHVV